MKKKDHTETPSASTLTLAFPIPRTEVYMYSINDTKPMTIQSDQGKDLVTV